MNSTNEFKEIKFICQIFRMADRNEINPLNAPGRFYNDLSCIDCDICRGLAPDIFKRDDEEGLTYVVRQPSNVEEEALAFEALEACPTETIGCDGLEE